MIINLTQFLSGITEVESTVIKYTVVFSIFTQLAWFAWWHRSNELKTERQRAYVLSLLSSIVMTLGSLPYVYQVTYHQRGNLDLLLTSTPTSAFRTSQFLTLMPVALTTFFMSFLILDLVVGLVWYKSKIEVLTGYAHHLVYFCLLAWVLNRHYGGIFMGMCVLEIPTLLLSAGSVHGPWRQDYLFALTFLATRIVFHGYIVACAYSLYGLAPITRALAAFLPVHLYWFVGFIQQQKRLHQLNRGKKQDTTTVISTEKNQKKLLTSQKATNPTTSTTTTITTNSGRKKKPVKEAETTIRTTAASVVTTHNIYSGKNKSTTITYEQQHVPFPGSFNATSTTTSASPASPPPVSSSSSSSSSSATATAALASSSSKQQQAGKIRGFWDRAYQRLRQEQQEQEKREQQHTMPVVPAH